jgi:oxygen-independent coproporphyrinogen-3 oxidase
LVDDYIEALLREIAFLAGSDCYPELCRDELKLYGAHELSFDTLYFGGGTPSLLRPESISKLVSACTSFFRVVESPEITLEVNPATSTRPALRELRLAGVNRISLGIQSLNDDELLCMGRPHTASEAVSAFNDLRAAGFHNISVDLIAGFPGQSVESVASSLHRVLDLEPEHLSIYLVDIKSGTQLDALIREGALPAPDDDLAADLYDFIGEAATKAGYEHYEISNFARDGRFSRHNLKYWQDKIYLGLGAGAHGMTGRHRYANSEVLGDYQDTVREGRLPLASLSQLTPEVRFKDALIMGLRLVNGLDLSLLGERYGVDAVGFVRDTIGDLDQSGLFRFEGNTLLLTHRGRLLSNIIFSRWV